jgi:glyceraldehyde 3-phosphate dehydrogenase
MTIKLGINGFGRIGRNVLRQILAREASGQRNVGELVIERVNDLTNATTLAHLIKYDSVHGILPYDVVTEGDSTLIVKGHKIKISAERDPANLAWNNDGVELVLECTGIFTEKKKASAHITAGAKRVVISAPSPDPDITIAYGVNHQSFDPAKHQIISCASCTTNCLAPLAKVMLKEFGIKRGTMTTIHSYTNDQSILDLPHKDLRRARAAALSMIPTTTGAAKAVGLVLPELKGKVDGFAIRVPTPDVSIVDFVVELEKEVTVSSVNAALKKASEGELKGILAYSTEPLVSIDYVGNTHSSIVDSDLTMVIGGTLVKIISWYDNEMGFSTRMVDVCEYIDSKSVSA